MNPGTKCSPASRAPFPQVLAFEGRCIPAGFVALPHRTTGGYASVGRIAGRGASCLSSDFAPRTARDRSASELRRTIRRSLGEGGSERCSGDRGAWWENARDLVPARCQFRSTQFTGDIPDSSPGCGRGVSPPTLRGTPAVPFGPGVVHGTVSVLFMNRSV
jgi:hypothetical protein